MNKITFMVLRLNVVWECGFQYHWWKGTKLISVTCSICFVRVQTHRMFKLGKSSDIYSQAGVPKMSDFFLLEFFWHFWAKSLTFLHDRRPQQFLTTFLVIFIGLWFIRKINPITNCFFYSIWFVKSIVQSEFVQLKF